MIRPIPVLVTQYAQEIGFVLDGEAFCDFYESKGWKVGKNPMVDWKAAVRTWKKKVSNGPQKAPQTPLDPVRIQQAKDRMDALREREYQRLLDRNK